MPEYSDEFVDYLSRFENFRPSAYWIKGEYWDKDKKKKKYTIGYGTTLYSDGTKVKEGDQINQEDALKYLRAYLDEKIPQIKKILTNWDKMPQQAKEGILSIVYRGGSLNKSKNFAKAVNDAYADGWLDTNEYASIISQMNFNHTGNLQDRTYRNAALLGNLYNYDDNKSINYALQSRSPYQNFNNNVFYPGNKWNNRWQDIQHLHESQANFAQRVRDPNREHIDLGNGYVATHEMSWTTDENGNNVLYPQIQEVDVYPRWDIFHLTKPDRQLKRYPKEEWRAAYDNAVNNSDTIHVKDPEWISQNYKRFYKNFKHGGIINYLDYINL